ncbi:hypothetical protein [Enterobacter cloacae]|uniref:hypothetical protein n=1 Tax=Enterobacter cloacae TaxID=550 RepID=UPI003D6EB347
MWLVGFGLAVICYWRQVGALNAFGLVPDYLLSGHFRSSITPRNGHDTKQQHAHMAVMTSFSLSMKFRLFTRRQTLAATSPAQKA